jgi:hypothetical protein
MIAAYRGNRFPINTWFDNVQVEYESASVTCHQAPVFKDLLYYQ